MISTALHWHTLQSCIFLNAQIHTIPDAGMMQYRVIM